MKHPSARAITLVLAVALGSFAAGCAGAPPQAVVRARAASDLACTGGGEGSPFDATCTRVAGVAESQGR